MKAVFAILLPLLLTGCVGGIRLPSKSQTYGKVITRVKTSRIVPGQTTRSEVVEKLGVEYRSFQGQKTLAYPWETSATGWAWGMLIVLPPSGLMGGNYHESSHWRSFFLECHSGGRVQRTKFAHLSGHKSLDEQLENWVLHGSARPLAEFVENGGGIFNPTTGSLGLWTR